MRVLVCGGRQYNDHVKVYEVLDDIHAKTPINIVIQGAATGADALAADWAKRNEVNCLHVPAKWKAHGKAAGPKRNAEMLFYEPNLVVAFPGGRGTDNMVEQAINKKVTVNRHYDKANI